MSDEKNVKEEIVEEVKQEAVGSETVEQSVTEIVETGSEKKENDNESYKAEAGAAYISSIVALLLTIVFYSAQYFIDGTPNYGLCTTIFGMLAAEKIVMYSKRKGRRNLILSILYTLLAVSCGVLTFVNLLK